MDQETHQEKQEQETKQETKQEIKQEKTTQEKITQEKITQEETTQEKITQEETTQEKITQEETTQEETCQEQTKETQQGTEETHQETNNETSNQQTHNNTNSKVEELSAMFPQIQTGILEAVLAARDQDMQACIPDLLEMSDPSYKPSHQESLVRADEQLARQLSLQHQEQISTPPTPPSHHNLPYQPRIKQAQRTHPLLKHPNQNQQAQPSSSNECDQGKDEIQKIADEIGKLAETGKKTMSLWFNKAKAKMQEIQTTAITGPTPSDAAPGRESGGEKIHEGYESVERPSPTSPTTTTTKPRVTSNLPYGSRYNNTPSSSSSKLPVPSTSLTSSRALSPLSSSVGYKVDDPYDKPSNLKEKQNMLQEPANSNPTTSGLSEKNPLPIKSKVKHNHQDDDDEESLEYTRNPFEDDD